MVDKKNKLIPFFIIHLNFYNIIELGFYVIWLRKYNIQNFDEIIKLVSVALGIYEMPIIKIQPIINLFLSTSNDCRI